MQANLIQLTPELASRIANAFGPDTEIGSQRPSELIDTVAWYASNELDNDFLEANPNVYELDYLKQFFATMILDEIAQDESISGEEIEGKLVEVWKAVGV
jgi:hypothetical protein